MATWEKTPVLSKVTWGGSTYYLKDEEARQKIDALGTPTHFIGSTSTNIKANPTTNPIIVNDKSTTAYAGDIVVYQQGEFIWDGSKWIELGDLSGLGTLAYKNAGYTASQTISGVQATGSTTGSITVELDQTATALADKTYEDYTPAGTVSVTLSQTSTSISGLQFDNYTPEGDVDVVLDYDSQGTVYEFEYDEYTPAGEITVTHSDSWASVSLSGEIYVPSGGVTGSYYTASVASLRVDSDDGVQISGSVSTPDITITPSTDTFASSSFASEGTLPTFTPVDVNATTAGVTVSVAEGSETLVFSAAPTASVLGNTSAFNAGAFPTLSAKTALTGATATSSSLTFTGDKFAVDLVEEQRALEYATFEASEGIFVPTSAASLYPDIQASFSGTTESIVASSAKCDRAIVSTASFIGTAAAIKLRDAKYNAASISSATFSGTVAASLKFTGANYDKASIKTAAFNAAAITLDVGDINVPEQNVTFTPAT